MKHRKVLYIFISVILVVGLYFPSITRADTLGQKNNFFVNPNYDYSGRNQVSATLYAISTNAYYYVEDEYWASIGATEKSNFTNTLNQVAQEFDNNIYPQETALWGSVGVVGASNVPKVTILLERLVTGTGGYFDSTNEYPTSSSPTSNYRPMIIVNADSLNNNPRVIESLIAHELQHLISFNQKELLRSVSDDNWLNELRSEYSIDLVGYNEPFQNSSLQRRIVEFLKNPSDSLTEWINQPFEYGAISLFGKYLTEQYGPGILKETLQNSKRGIDSINDYFRSHNYQQSFEGVFKNWVIANYLNNISIDTLYGYRDSDLSNIHVTAIENNLFYPFNYTYSYSLKPWQPAWYKFNLNSGIPKSKTLKIEFNSTANFGLIYMDKSTNKVQVNSPMYISNLSSISYFVLSPYNRNQASGFSNNDPAAALAITMSFIDTALVDLTPTITSPTPVQATTLTDGMLIKNPGGKDIYVITNGFKRRMTNSAIAKYGNLKIQKPTNTDIQTFDSYQTSSYIRIPKSQQVYSVWSDNTKHLLRTSFKNLIKIGINPNSVFTVSPTEFRLYKTGRTVSK